jgi:hypothetical protein
LISCVDMPRHIPCWNKTIKLEHQALYVVVTSVRSLDIKFFFVRISVKKNKRTTSDEGF